MSSFFIASGVRPQVEQHHDQGVVDAMADDGRPQVPAEVQVQALVDDPAHERVEREARAEDVVLVELGDRRDARAPAVGTEASLLGERAQRADQAPALLDGHLGKVDRPRASSAQEDPR